jgi:hypothetical protein
MDPTSTALRIERRAHDDQLVTNVYRMVVHLAVVR